MYSENPLTIPKSKPLLTKVIILLIVIMFVLEIIFSFSNKNLGEILITLGAKWNTGIKNGEYWRLVSYGFLHGNLIHLLLNIVALNAFGKEVESIYGNIRFLIIFILSVILAGIASYNFSNHVAIGASGGLFGIVGALMYFFYKEKEEIIGAELRFKSIYSIIIINLLLGLAIPVIDNSAHIGGLLAGTILGIILCPEYKIVNTNDNLIIIKKKKQTSEVVGLLLFTLISSFLFYLTIIK